jgi:hypothetical protein
MAYHGSGDLRIKVKHVVLIRTDSSLSSPTQPIVIPRHQQQKANTNLKVNIVVPWWKQHLSKKERISAPSTTTNLIHDQQSHPYATIFEIEDLD